MFPIRDGIPRFVPASNYANSFGFQWNKYAKAQLDSHTGIPISTDRLRAALGTLDLKGERILEAGSGAGRFTEVLAKSGAEVVSFDFSSAVDANAANLGADRTVHLFQGDIFNIPLRPRSFDRVVCLGVVQHTPDPRSAFLSLSEYVKPGGQVVIDVYTRSATALMSWKYLLRPITKRMSQERLYNIIAWGTPRLVPVARFLRRVAGRAGSRIVPIVEYSYLGLPNRLNVDWAVLDTFDMYSPQHDHPQSMATVKAWFEQVGFEKVSVRPGPNGVVASGHRPM
jgi:SAM-dependent methyltransferase